MHFKSIFTTIQDPIFIADPETRRIVDCNESAIEKTGFSKDEILQMNAENLHPESLRETTMEAFRRHAAGEIATIETELVTKSGDMIPISINSGFFQQDGKQLVVGVFRDITEHKQIEEELYQRQRSLKESEERFTYAMEATNDGLFDWNIITNEIYFSPRWKRMLGYEDHELPNDVSVWETLTNPDDVKRSWKMQRELITHQRDRFEMEFKMKHKDDHWVDILSRATAIFDEEGTAVRVVGTHVDISEMKRIQQSLLESVREKETLLKEIHHRVKNNLQIISSLLDLQSDAIESDEITRKFMKCRSRIQCQLRFLP